jgi:ATP-dependent Clp protease ATP-binding subunit ClpA
LTAGLFRVLFLFMFSTAHMAERPGRVLTELAEIGMALARDIAAGAQAAETLEAKQAAALVFHQVARSVRLSLSLEARLNRERWKSSWDERDAVRRRGETRTAQVRAAVTRQMLAEAPEQEAERLLETLEDRLEEAALYDDFAAAPLEAAIARIRAGLGLPPEGPANDAAQPPRPPPGLHPTGPPPDRAFG